MWIPPAACVVSLVCVLSLSACTSPTKPAPVVESTPMAFEDLFTAVDTLRLDASTLIGRISFMDVSESGDVLISDALQKVMYIFSPSGAHSRTLSATSCHPERDPEPMSARFLDDGRIVASTVGGTYLFSADGSCEKTVRDWPRSCPSFCERRDSVYVFDRFMSSPRILVFSPSLDFVRDYDLSPPEFPGIFGIYLGNVGLELACFDHDVLYRYPESSDGQSLFAGEKVVLHKPAFFVPPPRDRSTSGNDDMGARLDEFMEISGVSTLADAIFALGDDHRLIKFSTGPLDQSVSVALSVVDHEKQTSVSILTDRRGPALAKNGLLYFNIGNEVLDSGKVGNPMFEVVRFRPF